MQRLVKFELRLYWRQIFRHLGLTYWHYLKAEKDARFQSGNNFIYLKKLAQSLSLYYSGLFQQFMFQKI